MSSQICGNGHSVGPGDRFCPTCGSPVVEPAAPPPAEPGSLQPPPPPPPPSEPAAPMPAAAGGRSPIPAILIGLSVILIAVAVVILLTRDDGTTTGPTGPIAGGTSTTTTVPGSTTTTPPGSTTTTTTTTVPAGVDADYPATGTWTVMVYAIGDNNLEFDLIDDLREMRGVTADLPGLRFVALADRSDEFTDRELGSLGDWTTAKLVEISGGRFREIADWGEANLGDAATLIDFFEAATTHAPADHYAVILWDHGSMTGVGADRSHDDVLEPWEIATGLEAGLAEAGIPRLDLIGFDTCLMASIEVASVVSPYASYMIASEEYEPNTGWDYSGFGYLAAAAPTVEGLGTSIVDAYIETSSPIDPTVTLSMLDLRRYPALAAAIEQFADAALSDIDASAAAIGRRRDKAVRFGSDPDPLKDWFMVDLGQMLFRISRTEVPVADEAAAAYDAIEALVVVSGTGDASRGARGISVHFPPSADMHYPDWYRAIGDPMWSEFLDGYFAAGRALPLDRRADVVEASPDTTYLFGDSGLEVTAVLSEGAQETVTSAVMWSGIPQEDGSTIFYSSDQGLVEGTEAWAFYDLTRLELSDGADVAVAFQQITYNEEITFFTITVPVAYRAPIDAANGVFDDPIDLTLKATVDLDTEDVTIGLFVTEFDTVAPFTADPTGLLFPKLPVRAPDGTVEWIVTIDVGLWADLDNLGFEFPEWPSGTPIYSELTVTDFGGYRDVFTVQTEVP